MADPTGKTFTVTVEPVERCNLSCRYCYHDNDSGRSMSREDLALALHRIAEHALQGGFGRIDLVWHGGEPLLAGVDFFRQATRELARLPSHLQVRHFVQTNGLLLDDSYCAFFGENGFQVGISLDGPPEIHDRFRIARGGSGTHAAVLAKVALLEKHRVPVGFCAVLTRDSRGKEGRIYSFFRALGHPFRVLPLIPSPLHPELERHLLRQGEFGEILCRLFDEWVSDKGARIRVAPLDIYLRSLLEGRPHECRQQRSCAHSTLGIRAGGEAALCAPFRHEPLGSVLETPIRDILSAPFCRQIEGRSDRLRGCHACRDWRICHGGCPLNAAAFGNPPTGRDPFCTDYQMVFAHLRAALKAGDGDPSC